MQLAMNLLTLRSANSLTQEQLSSYLNISRQAYSNYETSKRTPDLDTLIVLSQLYGITLDKLVNQNLGNEVAELKGPYHTGLNITTGDTIYLDAKEVELIMNYRKLSAESRTIIDGFCQPHKDKK